MKEMLKEEIKYYEEQLAQEQNARVSEYLVNKIFEMKEELNKLDEAI